MVNFDNLEIAFQSKNNSELRKAYYLFKLVNNQAFVKTGKILLNIALKLHFPLKPFVKPTIFSHFCGGESIEECDVTISKLHQYGIGTILDFSAEGAHTEEGFDNVTQELLRVIEKAKNNPAIPFAVFKMTGVARLELLEKLSSKTMLSKIESQEYQRVKNRINQLCKACYTYNLPIFIDAEESWIQDAIDALTEEMMALYNKEKAIIFNTLQMYRHDRYFYLQSFVQKARAQNFKIGIKFVRGAYMEKERERAAEKSYPTPIQLTKADSDRDYNKALEYSLLNLDIISFCVGTHNEESCKLVTNQMNIMNLQHNHPQIWFAQLLGMSDHISFNLSKKGYNVAKYVPYGSVNLVLPYLIRRAEENTSVAGQTGRELNLIMKELKRRKQ